MTSILRRLPSHPVRAVVVAALLVGLNIPPARGIGELMEVRWTAGGSAASVHGSVEDGLITAWHLERGFGTVAFAPDGSRALLTKGPDLLEAGLPNGQTTRLNTFQNDVWLARYTRDMRGVLTVSGDQTVLWDRETMKPLQTWQESYFGAVLAATVAPDGSQVLTGGRDGRVLLRKVESGDTLQEWTYPSLVPAVGWSPDGKSILLGAGKQIVVRSATTGEVTRLWDFTAPVVSLDVSSDGRWVAVGILGGMTMLCDLTTGAQFGPWAHGGEAWLLAFSPDGKRLALGTTTGKVLIQDLASGHYLRAWSDAGAILGLSLSPDGESIMTASAEGPALLREVGSGSVLKTWHHDQGIARVAFSADGSRALIASGENLQLRDRLTGEIQYRGQVRSGLNAMALAPDGKRAAIGIGREVRVIDLETGKQVQAWEDSGTITLMAFASGGERLLVLSQTHRFAFGLGDRPPRHRVTVRHLKTGKQHSDWTGLGEIAMGTVAADGKSLLLGRTDGHIVLHAVADGKPIRTWTQPGSIEALALSPDGRMIVSGSYEIVAQRDVHTGKTVRSWRYPYQSPTWVGFSPNGSMLFTSMSHGSTERRDAKSGQLLGIGPWGKIATAAFTPNGQYALLGEQDGPASLRYLGSSMPAYLRALFAYRCEERLAALRRQAGSRDRRRPMPVKDEFESSSRYEARLNDWKAEEATLAAEAGDAKEPVELPDAERVLVAASTLRDTLGTPELRDVRYDAETETFTCELAGSKALRGAPARLALSEHIPRRLAPDFKREMLTTSPEVRVAVSRDGVFHLKGMSLQIAHRRYELVDAEQPIREKGDEP